MTALLLVLIPLAVLGVVVGASLTAADAALLAISRVALERALEDKPERLRRRVLHQHDDAPPTLAAIGLGRVMADAVMAVAITAIVFETLDGWVLPTLLSILIAGVGSFLAVSVSPRTLGRRRPEAVAIGLSLLISITRTVLGPPARLLIHIGSAFTPGGAVSGGPYATEAELRHSVDRALENEQLEHDERDMIQGVFDLGGTTVREIMVPRTDMVVITDDTSAEKAVRLFVRSGFSRVPVIGENVDDLLGVLYIKDVIRAVHSPWDPRADRPVRELMRPAQFIPEFVAADDLLRQMQASSVHVAIVVDEYGGVSGIVTIEDVLEEIVGDIADEHDRREPEIEDLGEGRFRVPARESVSETGELFGLEIDDDDVDSIGGLLGKALGRVPIIGSHADVLGLHLEAERTSGRRKRLSTLIVSRAAREEEPDSVEAHADHASEEHDD